MHLCTEDVAATHIRLRHPVLLAVTCTECCKSQLHGVLYRAR